MEKLIKVIWLTFLALLLLGCAGIAVVFFRETFPIIRIFGYPGPDALLNGTIRGTVTVGILFFIFRLWQKERTRIFNNDSKVERKPAAREHSSDQCYREESIDDKLYSQIADEIDEKNLDRGLWLKCLVEANGDKEKSEILYIKTRAERLHCEHCVQEDILKRTPISDAVSPTSDVKKTRSHEEIKKNMRVLLGTFVGMIVLACILGLVAKSIFPIEAANSQLSTQCAQFTNLERNSNDERSLVYECAPNDQSWQRSENEHSVDIGLVEQPSSQQEPDFEGKTPTVVYEEAFTLLREKQYQAAEQAFSAFLELYPSHSLAGNAQYWLGQVFYEQGDFQRSAHEFAEAYQKYPNGTKGPDSLLKFGMSLTGMENNEEACLIFKKVGQDYAQTESPALARAVQEARHWKCN